MIYWRMSDRKQPAYVEQVFRNMQDHITDNNPVRHAEEQATA
jgi:hypothetical protein